MQAPFYPAEGTLTLRRSGLVKSLRFTHERAVRRRCASRSKRGTSRTSTRRWTWWARRIGPTMPQANPNGEGKTDLPKRPAFARGEINLSVPPLARTLTVEAKPAVEKLEPGGSTHARRARHRRGRQAGPERGTGGRRRRRIDPGAHRLRYPRSAHHVLPGARVGHDRSATTAATSCWRTLSRSMRQDTARAASDTVGSRRRDGRGADGCRCPRRPPP